MLMSWYFLKSVISGGTTALVDLSLLFVFREILHVSYWLSVNTSFAVAIAVNFSLQKFWTFSNKDLDSAHKQFIKFFLLAMGNMAMNSLLMYVLSIVFGLWYLGAQVITIGTLAIVNFVLYRNFVFK
ncbi:MAG: GtrA family protein [Candidatus Paceibacterota bacterium]|jgi:putative flippase GtrA